MQLPIPYTGNLRNAKDYSDISAPHRQINKHATCSIQMSDCGRQVLSCMAVRLDRFGLTQAFISIINLISRTKTNKV